MWLVAIFLFALAVRAFFLFELFPNASRIGLNSSVGMAFDGYDAIARQLIQGHGFRLETGAAPTAARAPLYPLLLAGLYRVFGTGIAPVLWTHALLGALACALLFLAGCHMFGRAVGVTAGFMLALLPTHIWWSQYLLSETLLVTLIVATFLADLLFQAAQAGVEITLGRRGISLGHWPAATLLQPLQPPPQPARNIRATPRAVKAGVPALYRVQVERFVEKTESEN
jgi:4-amino-4-deoxy-L-arabinose transferase-like glycosyltransferase